MRIILFLFALPFLTIAGGCGSGGGLLTGGNAPGSVIYNDNGDGVESGTAIFDNGTNSYRVEISGGSFNASSVPAGTYKVWFENVGKLPVRKEYLSLEKTPVQVNVVAGQPISLKVISSSGAKKGAK